MQMQEVFRENLGAVKVIADDMRPIMWQKPSKIINSHAQLSEADKKIIRQKAEMELAQKMALQLIQDYGSNYRVKIKYKALGFID